MTEAEWMTANAPGPLLKWLQRSKRHRPKLRKLQLLANALTDRIADRFTDPVSIVVREFMARMTESQLSQARILGRVEDVVARSRPACTRSHLSLGRSCFAVGYGFLWNSRNAGPCCGRLHLQSAGGR